MTPVQPRLHDGRDLQQARHERTAQEGQLAVQRVRELDARKMAPVGAAVKVIALDGGERERRRLDVAGGCQRVRDASARALGRGEPAPRRRSGQHGGHLIEPMDASHLFGKGPPVGEVGTPRRREDQPGRGRVGAGIPDVATDQSEGLDDLVGRVVDADQPRDEAAWQLDRRLFVTRAQRAPERRVKRPASQLHHQVCYPTSGREGNSGVHAAFEAARGFRRQLVSARRPRDRHRVEPGCLDEHGARRGPHLCRGPAHHSGKTDRTGFIGDQEVLGVERAHLPIEGLELLTGAGASDGDPALKGVVVVPVDGVPELEHHIVGDVDEDAEGPHAGEGQPRDHPRWCGLGSVHITHETRNEFGGSDLTTNGVGVIDGDREALAGIHVLPGPVRRVAERRPRGVRVFARHTPDRERVAAVGGHVDLDCLIVKPQQRDGIRAHGSVDAEFDQTQDPRVVLTEPQLLGRGDHAVRDMSVGLARGDREGSRQHRSGQRHDHLVAGEEVARAAHDAADGWRVIRALSVCNAHLAPPDRLAVGLRLLDELENLAHHDRTRQIEAVNVLFFEADRH